MPLPLPLVFVPLLTEATSVCIWLAHFFGAVFVAATITDGFFLGSVCISPRLYTLIAFIPMACQSVV